MVTLGTSVVNFTLQARTDLAETETGKLSNATVFSAFGVEENGVRIFVKLDADTKTCEYFCCCLFLRCHSAICKFNIFVP